MWCVALFTCVAATAGPATRAGSEADWQVISLGQVDQVAVRLRVLKRASMAHEKWIGFEFENAGDKPIEVKNLHYRIESERLNLRTGRRASSGGLASGGPFDVFPEAWKTTPVSPRLIEPGIHRVFQQPSDCSSGLLGLPPGDGYLVQAKIFFDIELAGSRRVADEPGGRAFRFEWVYPDEAGLAAMRRRLRMLVKQPDNQPGHAYILRALLTTPVVSDSLSVEEALTGLTPRTRTFGDRDALVMFIDKHFANDARVIDYYRERLRAKDGPAAEDLSRVRAIWYPTFIQPLVAMCEAGNTYGALDALAAHRKDWASSPDVASRLSACVLRSCPLLSKAPGELNKADIVLWTFNAQMLGKTGDPKVVPLLRPFLDRRDRILDLKEWAPGLFFPLPPLRACDIALESILTLLGEDVQKVYQDAARKRGMPIASLTTRPAEFEATMTRLRDEMIVELKRRLDG